MKQWEIEYKQFCREVDNHFFDKKYDANQLLEDAVNKIKFLKKENILLEEAAYGLSKLVEAMVDKC